MSTILTKEAQPNSMIHHATDMAKSLQYD